MTTYPYEPPRREYADTLLAFRDFQMSSEWSALVEPDPRGPVNKIVTLIRGNRRIKTVLCPVPAGATVELRHENGGYSIADVFALREYDWRSGVGVELTRPEPGWYIDVAGKTVLYASEHETRLPISPAPKVPLWTRMRRVLRDQVRSDADWIAGRLGYYRNDECGRWDE